METFISGLSFNVTEAIKSHTTDRLEKDLSRFTARIRGVRVRLSDVNGPRGGIDKRCQLEVSGAGIPFTSVVELNADLYRAIDRASDRLRRHLSRLSERSRSRGMTRRMSTSGLVT